MRFFLKKDIEFHDIAYEYNIWMQMDAVFLQMI